MTDKPRTKVLSNGAVYDLDKGRIVANPGGGTTAITPELSSKYKQERRERRARIIAEAANAAVERDDYRRDYGDMAFVAAIAEAQYIKATTPDDPKSTAAANFLLEQAEISVKQAGAGVDGGEAMSTLAELGAQMVKHMTKKAREQGE